MDILKGKTLIKYIQTNHLKESDAQDIFRSIGWDVPQHKSEFFDENQTQICAFDKDKLVGFISGFQRRLDSQGDVAYISFVCVVPSHQGLGIGKQLLERFRKKFADKVLYFLVSSYAKSDAFYQKCGFIYDQESKMMIAKA